MPINPIAASLILYFELDYSELVDLSAKYPKFLLKSLTRTGYSTLHLMPASCLDPLEEFNSWPLESRDRAYFKMTQRKKAAAVKIIEDFKDIGKFVLQKGVISVVKFKNAHEFIEKAEGLVNRPDCCLTVLFTVKRISASNEIINGIKALLDHQKSLKLMPSALINCPSPDWTRISVSFSKGSGEGEFRILGSADENESGIFDLRGWRRFAGGITQLYSLKSELSYVIGITGKYGD